MGSQLGFWPPHHTAKDATSDDTCVGSNRTDHAAAVSLQTALMSQITEQLNMQQICRTQDEPAYNGLCNFSMSSNLASVGRQLNRVEAAPEMHFKMTHVQVTDHTSALWPIIQHKRKDAEIEPCVSA